jgi:hypothetical protein
MGGTAIGFDHLPNLSGQAGPVASRPGKLAGMMIRAADITEAANHAIEERA